MIKNKKIITFIIFVIVLTLSACKSSPTSGDIGQTIDSIDQVAENTPTPTLTPAETQTSDQTKTEDNTTEQTEYPILDKEITEALTTMMYESFGGSGNEELATSWYKYIDYWEVLEDESTYTGILHLKEQPYDYSARVLLAQYYNEDELDGLCPILMNTGASLDLDSLDLCLIGEDLYKIRNNDDSATHYSSLAALNIPVYDYISQGFGRSVKEVKGAIKDNLISGEKAYECLVDYMEYNYKDTFNGLSMEDVKKISMAALSNFSDVSIESMKVYDPDNKLISTYQKQN